MPREVFVAGQVLTADELNTVSDQTVMVFAGTAARGSAIPSPTEGMVTYLADADELQVYTNAWGGIAGGKILQVVSTAKTDTFSASLAQGARSGDVTGLTASITPSSTSNKVLVIADVNVAHASGSEQPMSATLFRGGSILTGAAGTTAGNRQSVSSFSTVGVSNGGNLAIAYLDSPASTSSLTYSVRLSHGSGSTVTVYVNRLGDDSDANTSMRAASTITVMEVAA